jgi:hypothetical protein
MIDVKKMRADALAIINAAGPYPASASKLACLLKQAIGEIERLTVRIPYDTEAAREELERIDRAWADDPRGGYISARALLDRALAAIDAGWPAPVPTVDIEGAAIAAWRIDRGQFPGQFRNEHPMTRDLHTRIARAVLSHVGRSEAAPVPDIEGINAALAQFTDGETVHTGAEIVALVRRLLVQRQGDHVDYNAITQKYNALICETLPSPRPITDAMVEEAAVESWLMSDDGDTRESWAAASDRMRDGYRREARAVLEYAASLGGLAHAASRRYALPIGETRPILCTAYDMTEEQVIRRLVGALDLLADDLRRCVEESHAPVVTAPQSVPSEAERLTRYRCAAASGFSSNIAGMRREYREACETNEIKAFFHAWLNQEIETLAHAMLAAERNPT